MHIIMVRILHRKPISNLTIFLSSLKKYKTIILCYNPYAFIYEEKVALW